MSAAETAGTSRAGVVVRVTGFICSCLTESSVGKRAGNMRAGISVLIAVQEIPVHFVLVARASVKRLFSGEEVR